MFSFPSPEIATLTLAMTGGEIYGTSRSFDKLRMT